MFSAVDPSPRYEGERTNYRADRVKKPVSTPVNARDVQPRLVHEDPADEIRGLGKRKIPATTQRPTRGTNVPTVYARLLHQPYADAGRFQMHEGDVVFVGRSTTLVGPRLGAYSSGAVVGAGVDRVARVATWRQVNEMLERPENVLHPADPLLPNRLRGARNEWRRMMEQRSLGVLTEAALLREGTASRLLLHEEPKPIPACADTMASIRQLPSGLQRDIKRTCAEEERAGMLSSRGGGLPVVPEVDWMAVPALNNWTPDGVLLNTDRVKEVISELLPAAADNELLLNVVVQGPCPLRNDKHAKDGQFFQQDAKAGDSLYLCVVYTNDFDTGAVHFRMKPCSGGQMQTLFDLTESSASAIALLGEKDEADGSTFSARDLLRTVAAWRIGRVVDTRLVTNVPQRRLGLNVSVELLTWDALWASLSHSDEPALFARGAFETRMLGFEDRRKRSAQTMRTTFGLGGDDAPVEADEEPAPAPAPESVETAPPPPPPPPDHFGWNMYQKVALPLLTKKAGELFEAVAKGTKATLGLPTPKQLAAPAKVMNGEVSQAGVVATALSGIKHVVAAEPLTQQQALKQVHRLTLQVGFFKAWDQAMERGLSPEDAEIACTMLSDLTHPVFGSTFGEILVCICNKVREKSYTERYDGGLHFDFMMARGGKAVTITDLDLNDEMGMIEGSRADKECAISEALNFLFRAPATEMWTPLDGGRTWRRSAKDQNAWGPHQRAWNYYTLAVTTVAAGTSMRAKYMAMLIGTVVLGLTAYVVTPSVQKAWAEETFIPEPPQTPTPSPSAEAMPLAEMDTAHAKSWGEFVHMDYLGAQPKLWLWLWNRAKDTAKQWTAPPTPTPGGIGDPSAAGPSTTSTTSIVPTGSKPFLESFTQMFAWSVGVGGQSMGQSDR